MSLRARHRNGHIRFYDSSTDYTTDVRTTGPKIIDNFELDSSGLWLPSAVNGSTQAVADGICTITTGAADDDDHEMTSGLIFDPSKGLTAECRLALNDADLTAFNFGFSDAVTEAADLIAVTYDTATVTTTATDAAVFFSDPDATSDFLGAIAVNGDADGTEYDGGAALVDDAFHTYRVEISPNGDCNFWYDGTLVLTELLGVAPTATLCAYLALINREGAANTMALSFCNAWQWRA